MKYRIPDVLVWGTVFFLWKEYYRLVDPPQLVWIFTAITTFFAAISFYFTYYFLVPFFLNRKNLLSFIISVLLTVIILASIRSSSIYISFSNIFPDKSKYFDLFKSITASSFHISYAITFATLIRFFIDRYETQKKLDLITKENLRTELNYLKAQVNPHFLFNIYNSIYFLIEENPRLASEALLKLSGIMQYQLYDCRNDTVPFGKEVENIQAYVELETMRVDEVVKVGFSSKIDNPGQPIAPFILLTFIENSFKHVSKEAGRENRIDIFICQRDSSLKMKIENTISEVSAESSQGIGLANVKRRLELLYPGRYKLDIDKNEKFYTTSLKLTL